MGLRGKLLLPAAFISLALVAYLALGWIPGPPGTRTGIAPVSHW
jgi:hypothetical protein